MKKILEIQDLSKKFSINHEAQSYLSLRDRFSRIGRGGKATHEDFWALQDVSFDVYPGESIGIIGKNGAGKSTLLKILSKITPPSKGRILSRGRIASLLEVGTGFHPELTGRENIFLNGSILGMKRKEIETRFDEIVDFAGTEKFLDTPLKHYSSGMQLRLAFSVAAFLEPEILVIDEVLAVGDAEFQKKCLGKMEDVSRSGRTVLFVSHNMAALENLCERSILLEGGKLKAMGSSSEVIHQYLNLIETSSVHSSGEINLNSSNLEKPVHKIEIFCDQAKTANVYMGCKLEIKVHFESSVALEAPVLGLIFKDNQNIPLIGINNKHYVGNMALKPITKGYISMQIPYLTLFEGLYHVDVHFGNAFRDIEVLRDCFQITVEPMKFTTTGDIPDKKLNRFFIPDVFWKLGN